MQKIRQGLIKDPALRVSISQIPSLHLSCTSPPTMLAPGSSLVVERERCYMSLFSKRSRLINSGGGSLLLLEG